MTQHHIPEEMKHHQHHCQNIINTTARTSKLAFLAILIQLNFHYFLSYLETFMHAHLLPLKTTNFGEILHVLQAYSIC